MFILINKIFVFMYFHLMKKSIERRLVKVGIRTIEIYFLCRLWVRLRLRLSFDNEDGQDLHHVGGAGRGGRLRLLFVGLDRRVFALRLCCSVFGRRSIVYNGRTGIYIMQILW